VTTSTTSHDHPTPASRASERHHLPPGWHEVHLSAVAWPIVVGPGGVFVIFARDTAAAFGRRAAWHGERRDSRSGAQLTAALVSQLVSATSGSDVECTPLVVIDDTADIATRPDLVTVLHHRRLTGWLEERPAVFDAAMVDHLVRTLHRA
jgi:hypothetical protein